MFLCILSQINILSYNVSVHQVSLVVKIIVAFDIIKVHTHLLQRNSKQKTKFLSFFFRRVYKIKRTLKYTIITALTN